MNFIIFNTTAVVFREGLFVCRRDKKNFYRLYHAGKLQHIGTLNEVKTYKGSMLRSLEAAKAHIHQCIKRQQLYQAIATHFAYNHVNGGDILSKAHIDALHGLKRQLKAFFECTKEGILAEDLDVFQRISDDILSLTAVLEEPHKNLPF